MAREFWLTGAKQAFSFQALGPLKTKRVKELMHVKYVEAQSPHPTPVGMYGAADDGISLGVILFSVS
ncbi:hypothetical protein TNCV_792701 [Trichonephila clavipes]|nr:hypothetical protein TNCV_792701 [Trichonephila clavipes]